MRSNGAGVDPNPESMLVFHDRTISINEFSEIPQRPADRDSV